MRKLSEEKLAAERERLELMKSYERQYEDSVLVCGIDEAGRGPLAGPVVAGAVILPRDCEILFLNDSKKLSELSLIHISRLPLSLHGRPQERWGKHFRRQVSI